MTRATDVVVLLSTPDGSVALSGNMVYLLTPCCGASATGSMGGVACRSCYHDVPTGFGWGEWITNMTAESLSDALLFIEIPQKVVDVEVPKIMDRLHREFGV